MAAPMIEELLIKWKPPIATIAKTMPTSFRRKLKINPIKPPFNHVSHCIKFIVIAMDFSVVLIG
jgi:hypothetical protein